MKRIRNVKAGRLSTPVFVFDHYVDFLQAWYGYARRFRVTQKSFIEKAGVGTQAYFSDVLARRKKLSVKFIHGFATALELEGDEAEFFSLLVLKEHADKGPDKEKVLKKLAQLREKHLSSIVTNANAEYFSSWKYPVIREYIVSKKYVVSLHEIKKAFLHFTMSVGEVRRTVDKLVQWKMVEYVRPGGGIRACSGKGTIAYSGMPHMVVNDVKRLFIESSLHAMETLSRDDRHISMAVKGISRQKYELFCSEVDALRERFLADENPEDTTEYVYGMNVQIFPLMSVADTCGNADEKNENGKREHSDR
ncbi:MAG: TIGR02147 family protein [Chitinispirillaceae bacterium]|nr:TIGR02147 family protein [Chitinispirillaceae bacterium]